MHGLELDFHEHCCFDTKLALLEPVTNPVRPFLGAVIEIEWCDGRIAVVIANAYFRDGLIAVKANSDTPRLRSRNGPITTCA
jgi:hypothetical protein